MLVVFLYQIYSFICQRQLNGEIFSIHFSIPSHRVHKELKVLMVIPGETETLDEMVLLVDQDML